MRIVGHLSGCCAGNLALVKSVIRSFRAIMQEVLHLVRRFGVLEGRFLIGYRGPSSFRGPARFYNGRR